jgi:hypothetical protein
LVKPDIEQSRSVKVQGVGSVERRLHLKVKRVPPARTGAHMNLGWRQQVERNVIAHPSVNLLPHSVGLEWVVGALNAVVKRSMVAECRHWSRHVPEGDG